MITENYHSSFDRYNCFYNRYISLVEHNIFIALNQAIEKEITFVKKGMPTIGAGHKSIIDFLPNIPKASSSFNEFTNALIVLEWGRDQPVIFDFDKDIQESPSLYFNCHVGRYFNERFYVNRLFIGSQQIDYVVDYMAKNLTNRIKIQFCYYIELIFCLYIKISQQYQSYLTIMEYVVNELRKEHMSYQNPIDSKNILYSHKEEVTRILNQDHPIYEYGVAHE